MRDAAPRRMRRGLWAAACCLALAGCAGSTAARYDDLLAFYQAQDALRTERAPPDAPFGNADLIRNFERIAFFTEFAPPEAAIAGGGRFEEADGPPALVAQTTPIALMRWSEPVRWSIEGDGATEVDRAEMRALAARLSLLTGLEFTEMENGARGDVNFSILIASAPLRDAFGAMLRESGGAARMPLAMAWTRDDRYPCVGQIGVTGEGVARETRALVLIKAETRGLLRLACLHEEVVQSLGLPNDDPRVRPSIFNDDQEFALMTLHDEYLLRILYDPRLAAGMTAAEGMPIVRRIVAEIGPDRPGRGAEVAAGP